MKTVASSWPPDPRLTLFSYWLSQVGYPREPAFVDALWSCCSRVVWAVYP